MFKKTSKLRIIKTKWITSNLKLKMLYNKVKRQDTNWEKISVSNAIGKRFIFRIYKEVFKISKEKTKKKSRKMGKGSELEIHSRGSQMTKTI